MHSADGVDDTARLCNGRKHLIEREAERIRATGELCVDEALRDFDGGIVGMVDHRESISSEMPYFSPRALMTGTRMVLKSLALSPMRESISFISAVNQSPLAWKSQPPSSSEVPFRNLVCTCLKPSDQPLGSR